MYIDDSGTNVDANSVVYYKLKQVDYNGATKDSPVQAVKNCAVDLNYDVRILPNPATDQVTIQINGAQPMFAQTVIIRDAQGRVVAQVSAGDKNKVVFDTSLLSNGLYTVQVIQGNRDVRVEKFVVSH